MGIFDKIKSRGLKKPKAIEESPVNRYDLQEKKSEDNTPKIVKILHNTNCEKGQLSNQERLEKNKDIFEKMSRLFALPYMICDCGYIGEGKAWAMFNQNNKVALLKDIEEINAYLSQIPNLKDEADEEKELHAIFSTKFHIDFDKINFEFQTPMTIGSIPLSHLIYNPQTKTGKWSQHPLAVHFYAPHEIGRDREFYSGDLYYSINGDLSKALVSCVKNDICAEVHFSTIGRSFLISAIKTRNEKFRTITVYNCVDDFIR